MSSLFIGDSCMLHFFALSLDKNLINDIYYTYWRKTSTCIFDEVNNEKSILYTKKFDYYIIGLGDMLRNNLFYSMSAGLNDRKDIDNIVNDLIEKLVCSIKKMKEITNNPIFLSTYIIDIYNNKLFSYKYSENPIKHYWKLIYNIYNIAETYDLYILDVNSIIFHHGINSNKNIFRYEIYGSHMEEEGGKLLAEYFCEKIKCFGIKKIKVAVFDLDNTLWNGVLREDENVKLYEFRTHIMYQLYKMGILLCICSKNDNDEKTLKLIKKNLQSISDKIVIYKVNWNRKSENILEISKELNIGLDTIAFFDDQPFERDEVKSAIPKVHVYSENEIDYILKKGIFNYFNISNESKNRTIQYQQNIERDNDEEKKVIEYSKYDDYLKTINFRISFRNFQLDDLDRCQELTSRTNKQNLTLLRLKREDILQIYNSSNGNNIFVVELDDKFGSYGIISFIIINCDSNFNYSILEFPISCRAMGKKVEECLLIFINNILYRNNIHQINMKIQNNESNSDLISKFKNFGFTNINENEFNLKISSEIKYPEWFNVNEKILFKKN